MIASIGLCIIVLSTVLFTVFILSNKKPKQPIMEGDYVMFRSRYKKLFPQVPTSHALRVEKIVNNEAVVVFMTLQTISKATMPLYLLTRAV